ncbi:MAG: hypothetical protein QOF57_1040 [Frankiaceae bacterium]|nr:hypothetical protein [Frankiaceae bacterium]
MATYRVVYAGSDHVVAKRSLMSTYNARTVGSCCSAARTSSSAPGRTHVHSLEQLDTA